MTGKEKLRRILQTAFVPGLAAVTVLSFFYMKQGLPDKLNLVPRQEADFRCPFPVGMSLSSESEEVVLRGESNIPADEIHLSLNQPFSLYAEKKGTYRVDLKLFGWIPMKEIEVSVAEQEYAVPCGFPVGIYMRSDGLMVIGTGELQTAEGIVLSPSEGLLRSGDYIEEINGKPAEGKDDMTSVMEASAGEPVELKVRREGKESLIRVEPVRTEEDGYKLGIWIRDDTQGIGTMTYVKESGAFGALGHGISDPDTGMLVKTDGGELYETEILGVEKGTFAKPGVMSGVIYYGKHSRFGTVSKNTESGIFGTVNGKLKPETMGSPVPVGHFQDAERGKAVILSTVSGKPEEYEIEIERVDRRSGKKGKNMVLHVTDPELLRLTGGIVQGMSGSPILQNGKLIGAVTHVLVNDPTRGYGIFIENMLDAAK